MNMIEDTRIVCVALEKYRDSYVGIKLDDEMLNFGTLRVDDQHSFYQVEYVEGRSTFGGGTMSPPFWPQSVCHIEEVKDESVHDRPIPVFHVRTTMWAASFIYIARVTFADVLLWQNEQQPETVVIDLTTKKPEEYLCKAVLNHILDEDTLILDYYTDDIVVQICRRMAKHQLTTVAEFDRITGAVLDSRSLIIQLDHYGVAA